MFVIQFPMKKFVRIFLGRTKWVYCLQSIQNLAALWKCRLHKLNIIKLISDNNLSFLSFPCVMREANFDLSLLNHHQLIGQSQPLGGTPITNFKVGWVIVKTIFIIRSVHKNRQVKTCEGFERSLELFLWTHPDS